MAPRYPDPVPATPPRVLIVEDHELTRRFLADNLLADGYDPLVTGSVADARQLIATELPAIAVLDLGLPDGDGLALLSELRRPGSELDPGLPVLILSGRASELDRVRGLERGADDYLAKPFSYPELRLRLAALLRRTAGRIGIGRIQVRSLELDSRSREVWVRGEPIHLSRKEFALLGLLARAPTYTYTRAELLREVWGFHTSEVKTRTLDSHAHRLRLKLSTPTDPYIVNVWGVGYRLVDPGTDQ
ncbi:MAG: response regulator transcription factor [Solirubrobacteraceae bacterium]